jgi:hypothetical protein
MCGVIEDNIKVEGLSQDLSMSTGMKTGGNGKFLLILAI